MTALILLLIAAAYIILGTFHLAAPTKVLPVYRFLLGRLFTKNASRFEQITPTNWKFMGAAYILFGMLLVWTLRSSF